YFKQRMDPSLEGFFQNFDEGDRNLTPTNFFVQARLRKGRLGIGYKFESENSSNGEMTISVMDNGEKIPSDEFSEIYSTIRNYLSQRTNILEENSTVE
ncbi:hypothetical protein J4474_04580, partial [Candidatus Pacearchaeota archaeon]|nr:hypothetical protein [Candidatus Pacearchaeota archaeon]